jgi:hypothetical protein
MCAVLGEGSSRESVFVSKRLKLPLLQTARRTFQHNTYMKSRKARADEERLCRLQLKSLQGGTGKSDHTASTLVACLVSSKAENAPQQLLESCVQLMTVVL